MKKLNRFFIAINILLVIVTLISYLSPIANPRILWPISVVAVFYPWLLLANTLFVFFWFFVKTRYSLISLVCILIGIVPLQKFIGIHSQGFQSHPSQIEILSYNVQNLNYIFQVTDNRSERTDAFIGFMDGYGELDIICLQEVGPRSKDLLKKRFNFPHIWAPEIMGPMILSKHPIVQTGQIHSSTSTVNSCLWVDVNIKGNTYRIYNLHMQSNKITRTAEKVIREVSLQNKATWDGIKSIIVRYKDNAAFRIEHAERIRDHMLESPYPVIVAGDFNDVPMSYMYRILSLNYQDSFLKRGTGLGITFAGKIPALRIDYILADQEFKILNHKIIRKDFSDHYPIKSIILHKGEP